MIKNKKWFLGILTIVFLTNFFLICQNVKAQEEVAWPLKKSEIENILDIARKHPLSAAQADFFYEALSSGKDFARKTGAVVLIKQAILKLQLDYWFRDMPKAISKKLIISALKVGAAIYSGDIGQIIGWIENLTAQEAVNYGIDWLMSQQIKIGAGQLTYTFDSYKKTSQTANFQYIIFYQPNSQKAGKLSIEFYSANPIEPPLGTGGVGSMGNIADWANSTTWPSDRWLLDEAKGNNDGLLEPFTIRISGAVVKNNYNDFAWDKSQSPPILNVDFTHKVPEVNKNDLVWQGETSMKKFFLSENFLKPLSNFVKALGYDIGQLAKSIGQTIFKSSSGLIEKIKIYFVKTAPKSMISQALPQSSSAGGIAGLGNAISSIANSILGQLTKNQNNNGPVSVIYEAGYGALVEQIDLANMVEQFDNISEQADIILSQADLLNGQAPLSLAVDNSDGANASNGSNQEQNVGLLIVIESANDSSTSQVEQTTTQANNPPAPNTSGNPAALATQKTTPAGPDYCAISVNDQPKKQGVIFNEIAWMGASDSSANEWIELTNQGQEKINLNGWQIQDKDQQIKMILPNYWLEPNSFFIAERTSDSSAPMATADIIYSGALNNSQETIYLLDNHCQMQDKVSATSSWPAGDNSTKQTMELCPNTATTSPAIIWHSSDLVDGTPREANSICRPAMSTPSVDTTETATSTPPASEQATSTNPTATSTPTTATSTDSGQATSTPAIQPAIVIAQIQIASPSSTNDDFIRLFNNSTSTIDLSNWQIKKRSKTGSESSIRVFPEGSQIAWRDYFTWANSNYQATSSFVFNTTSTQTLAGNNSIALFNQNKAIVDQVAWGVSNSPFVETMAFGQNPSNQQILQRKWRIVDQQYQDLNNNALDFEIASSTLPVSNQATSAEATSTDPLPEPEPEPAIAQPPAVASLIAIPSIQRQAIDLFWISLGPNKTAGYQITYGSAGQIISQVKPAGQLEHLLISGLVSGQTYTFAIQTTTSTSAVSEITVSYPAVKPLPGFYDNADNTLTDLWTGLVWPNLPAEIATNQGAGYSWQEAKNLSQNLVLCDNGQFVSATLSTSGQASSTATTSTTICQTKHDNWRLPAFQELGLLDEKWFSQMPRDLFWTSSSKYIIIPYNSPETRIEVVDFNEKQILRNTADNLPLANFWPTLGRASGAWPVTPVASTLDGEPPQVCDLACIDNNDNTLTEQCLGLMWVRGGDAFLLGRHTGGHPETIRFDYGLKYCQQLVLCNDNQFLQESAKNPTPCDDSHNGLKYDDWRMPNFNEAIFGLNKNCPKIFQWESGYNFYYWTSSLTNSQQVIGLKKDENIRTALYNPDMSTAYLQCVREQ